MSEYKVYHWNATYGYVEYYGYDKENNLILSWHPPVEIEEGQK